MVPFYEVVRSHSDWRTIVDPGDFYFVRNVADHLVLFLADHIDFEER